MVSLVFGQLCMEHCAFSFGEKSENHTCLHSYMKLHSLFEFACYFYKKFTDFVLTVVSPNHTIDLNVTGYITW